MINELSQIAEAQKVKEWVTKLESSSTSEVLATEAEISFVWALSKTTDIVVEPNLGTARRPEASSEDFFPFGPAVFEVRAISDDSFSGETDMQKTAHIISSFSNTIRKKSGTHLLFRFLDRSFWNHRGFNRSRCVDPEFQLSEHTKSQIKDWLHSEAWEKFEDLRISEGLTDVIVSRSAGKPLRHNRVSCSMPAIAYDIEKNPIFNALKAKSQQLANIDRKYFRCVVLYDAGCYTLKRLRKLGQTEFGGDEIILHCLQKMNIDSVIVLSPSSENKVRSFLSVNVEHDKTWKVTVFDKQSIIDPMLEQTNDYRKLNELASMLPRPHFEAYQARSLHSQGHLKPGNSFSYLPSTITERGDGSMTIKISSRLLLDLLSHSISQEKFDKFAFHGCKNLFSVSKERGNAINSVRLVEGGIDKDDDFIEFELDIDWTVAKLGTGQERN